MTEMRTIRAGQSRRTASSWVPASVRSGSGRLITRRNILVFYILAVFALGGGARADIASLAVLRPLAILVLGYAVLAADPAKLRANRALIGLAAGWAALVALHLVPLPPAIWQALPGRELAAAIDQGVGLGETWRPFSLVPYRTLNALLSLAVPFAGLLLAINCDRRELASCAALVVGLTFANAGLSLLQAGAGPGAPLHLYRVTNADTPVGLFANRNHSAILLALGIASLGALRILVEPPREWRRHWSTILAGAALALFPFLLITQSRAGLVLGALALGAAWWIARGPSKAPGIPKTRRPRAWLLPAIAAAAAIALVSLLVVGASLGDTGFSRLIDPARQSEELRFAIWPASLELARTFFPLGSGIGTFVEIYEAGEPASTLGATYVNHAHNDLIELALTGGLPALGLVALACAWLILAGKRLLSQARGRDLVLRRLGLVVVILLSMASLYDYPLRTPSLALTFILALVWIAGGSPASSQSLVAPRPAGQQQPTPEKGHPT